MEKISIPIPVVVEGKYDKMKLSQVIDADIITTDGFAIFNRKEKIALIKALSADGVILLCDSDGAGSVIRRCIMNAVPKEKIFNLYIPKIDGKERRKKSPSKEGTLGVEGMDEALLREMFEGFLASGAVSHDSAFRGEPVTSADLYEYGFTGREGSRSMRDKLCAEYALPDGMTPKALLGALNILTDRDAFRECAERIVRDGR